MIASYSHLKNGVLLILLLAGLNGCVSPNKPDLPQQVPVNWDVKQSLDGQLVSLRSWWTSFNDPNLDALVNAALNNNLDIAQSNQMLLKVRRLNEQSARHYLPKVAAGVQPVQDAAARENFLHASIDVTWEMSLYGESEYRKHLGDAVVLSAEAREQAVRIVVVANTVENYLRYTYTNQQLALLQRQFALEARLQALVNIRQRAHVATTEELASSKLRVARLEAKRIDLQQIQDQSSRVLALLTAKSRAELSSQLNQTHVVVPTIRLEQIPADLLRTRPDIRQAEADVLQSAAEVGLARAALYPRLILSGSILFSYNLTDNYRRMSGRNTPGFGPIIDIPLWDWGQRRNEKYAKEHELQAALFGYRKTVLAGISETEEALSSLAYQDKRMQTYNSAAEQQKHLNQMQATLKKVGFSSEYEGLTGQMTLLEIESELAESQFRRAVALVLLYKALGGAPLSVMTSSLATQAEAG